MVELLVVIVIIGILSSLVTIALNSSRMKARDAKRISEMKEVQLALELYYGEENGYPAAITPGQPIVGPTSGRTYMTKMPSSPTPRNEGACSNVLGQYSYTRIDSSSSALHYCLASDVNGAPAGSAYANAGSVHTPTCPSAVTDTRGDETTVYNTVWFDLDHDQIQEVTDQCWLKENLRTAKKPDGTALTHGVAGDYLCPGRADGANVEDCTDSPANGSGVPTGTASTLGFLYNWASLLNLPAALSCNTGANRPNCIGLIAVLHQGLCPAGWHLPSVAEGAVLGSYTNHSGYKLRETGTAYWNDAMGATNLTDFTARAAGQHYGFFEQRGTDTYFYTAWPGSSCSFVGIYGDAIGFGFSGFGSVFKSARCLKNY